MRHRVSVTATTAVAIVTGVGVVAAVVAQAVVVRRRRRRRRQDDTTPWRYATLNQMARDVALPAMFVHLPTFDANAAGFAHVARRHGVTVRLATKSVRVPFLIERVLDRFGDVFRGLMCFSVAEAEFWWQRRRLADLLVAYPAVQRPELAAMWRLTQAGCGLRVVVDSAAHVAAIAAHWERETARLSPSQAARVRPQQVCVDVDMSFRVLGVVHLGAHRSPCRTPADAVALQAAAAATGRCVVTGVMGYEAQVAGVPDRDPHQPWFMRAVLPAFKWLSMRDVVARRAAVVAALADHPHARRFGPLLVNAGGTGSVAASAADPSATEVTVGSGLLQAQLFDYFAAAADSHARPAFVFGLRVTRSCDAGVVTCQSGGFIASGSTCGSSAPAVFMPAGLRPFPDEGFGEVQTPLRVASGISEWWRAGRRDADGVAVGDAVFCRPAKAGEVAERFQQYHLVDGERVVGTAATYRGLGLAFY